MRHFRFISSRVLALALALGVVAPMAGCGSRGNEAVQTEEMNKHLQEVTGGYGQHYADQYRKGR